MAAVEALDTEVELISASILPAESLTSTESGGWPRIVTVTNADSQRSLHITVADTYPRRGAVTIELKGNDVGREEAVEWSAQIDAFLDEWDEGDGYPLYQMLTAHILGLLVPNWHSLTTIQEQPSPPLGPTVAHHVLLTSHHLLSPTKRKDFLSLASELSLTGFSKVGHPGIYYAIGHRDDLEQWLREVKSWNWLALRQQASDVLGQLLTPLSFAEYPTTFGPKDIDPFVPLLEAAKACGNPKDLFPALKADAATKTVLRGLHEELKKRERMPLAGRFKGRDSNPFLSYLQPLEPLLSRRAVREGEEVANQLNAPTSTSQLFLPHSKHFISGFLAVEPMPIPRVAVEDALNLRWTLEPGMADQLRRITASEKQPSALPPINPMEVISLYWMDIGVDWVVNPLAIWWLDEFDDVPFADDSEVFDSVNVLPTKSKPLRLPPRVKMEQQSGTEDWGIVTPTESNLQGADLVLSTRTAVVFLNLQTLKSNAARVVDGLKTTAVYYSRVIVVFEVLPYDDQQGDGGPKDPLEEDFVKALPPFRRRLEAFRGALPAGQVLCVPDIVFACRGAAEVAGALYTLTVNECRAVGGVDPAVCLEKEPSGQMMRDELKLITDFFVNAYTARLLLTVFGSLTDLIRRSKEARGVFGELIDPAVWARFYARPHPATFRLRSNLPPVPKNPAF
ncbi:hypothetical protein Q8F55_000609 [Vanrija albida]|uniref:Uncharacterized protein n=1 Tax=Vanrija albida TaxID=181172 RepID=A0ABR3QDR4_9TREE